jgi:ATP/maltotriose-dependent transcriptional regulator MalT
MTTHMRNVLMAGGMLMAVAAAPVSATAQQKLPPVRVTASAEYADDLALRAESLSTQVTQFKKAAQLFERSAEVRGPGDSRAVTCLRSAATLSYYSGDKRKGLGLMEKTADRAIRLGDVILAAHAYIDAAVIASELRQGARAQDLSERAALLAKSPLLSETQRTALLHRMSGWSVVGQVAAR